MADRDKVKCTVEFTDGAIDRITAAFVDLYYGILDGIYEGPLPQNQKKAEDETGIA